MRKSLVLAMVVVLACSSLVLAGVPDPARSGCGTAGAKEACAFTFLADGSEDVLTCCVTLRDAFDSPVVACSTSLTISAGADMMTPPDGGVPAGCKCDGAGGSVDLDAGGTFTITGVSDSSGIIYFLCDNLGGVGGVDLAVTTNCAGAGNIGICTKSNVLFSSTDLNGSCESGGAASTDVFDLGRWAGGLGAGNSTYASDYNCDLTTDVFDLGTWAGGLTVGCP